MLKELGLKEIECWTPDIELDEEQVNKLNLRLNKIGGEWDVEMLLGWNGPDDLLENGWNQDELENLWNEPIGEMERHEEVSEEEEAPLAKEPDVDENELEKKMETYLNNTIRQIVLYYDVDTHKNILERMERIQKATQTDDNSAAVLYLMEFYESQVAMD